MEIETNDCTVELRLVKELIEVIPCVSISRVRNLLEKDSFLCNFRMNLLSSLDSLEIKTPDSQTKEVSLKVRVKQSKYEVVGRPCASSLGGGARRSQAEPGAPPDLESLKLNII